MHEHDDLVSCCAKFNALPAKTSSLWFQPRPPLACSETTPCGAIVIGPVQEPDFNWAKQPSSLKSSIASLARRVGLRTIKRAQAGSSINHIIAIGRRSFSTTRESVSRAPFPAVICVRTLFVGHNSNRQAIPYSRAPAAWTGQGQEQSIQTEWTPRIQIGNSGRTGDDLQQSQYIHKGD